MSWQLNIDPCSTTPTLSTSLCPARPWVPSPSLLSSALLMPSAWVFPPRHFSHPRAPVHHSERPPLTSDLQAHPFPRLLPLCIPLPSPSSLLPAAQHRRCCSQAATETKVNKVTSNLRLRSAATPAPLQDLSSHTWPGCVLFLHGLRLSKILTYCDSSMRAPVFRSYHCDRFVLFCPISATKRWSHRP